MGHLEELRQRNDDPNRMEVMATGVDAAALKVSPTPTSQPRLVDCESKLRARMRSKMCLLR